MRQSNLLLRRMGIRHAYSGRELNKIIKMQDSSRALRSKTDEQKRKAELKQLRNSKVQDYEMNLRSFIHDIQRCGKHKKWKRALGIFKKLEKFGLVPNALVYNVTINVCRSANQMNEAVKLFEEMQEKHCVPDEFTYTELITGFGNLHFEDAALELYEEARDKNLVSAPLINSALSACSRGQSMSRAEDIWEEFGNHGIEPPSVSWATMLTGYRRIGDYDKVFEWHKRMESLGVSPTAYTHSNLLMAIGKAKPLAELDAYWEKLQESKEPITTFLYTNYLLGYRNHGKWEECLEMLDAMSDYKLVPGEPAVCIVMEALIDAKQFQKGLDLFDRVGREQRGEKLYELAITCAFQLGENEVVQKIFSEAVEYQCFPTRHESHPDQIDLESYNEPVVFAIVLSQLNKAKAELSRSGNASEIRLHADKRHIHSQRLSDLLSTRFHPPIPCQIHAKQLNRVLITRKAVEEWCLANGEAVASKRGSIFDWDDDLSETKVEKREPAPIDDEEADFIKFKQNMKARAL